MSHDSTRSSRGGLLALRIRKALNALSWRAGRRALRLGVAASIEHAEVLKLENWATIIDIGANRGQFSLAARRLNPHAEIFAFEPLTNPRELFSKVFSNDTKTHLIPVAIGPENLEIEMNVSRRDDSSSLLPIGPAQARIFPGTERLCAEVVAIRRLSQYVDIANFSGLTLLKIDVQGYELSALRGCEDILEHIDYVYVESSLIELYEGQALFSDIVGYMAAHQYHLYDIGPLQRLEGRLVQGDFLFHRMKSVEGAER